MVDNIVKLKTGPPETKDPVYTAMGAFITAYARDITVRAAQENYDIFAYADTDSLHLLTDTDPDNLEVDPTRLGAWKFEYGFDEALFVRAKGYTELQGEEWRHTIDGCKLEADIDPDKHHGEWCNYVTHIAGVPEGIAHKLTFADMTHGAFWPGKLTPERVPGGIVLKDVGFTLKLHT